MDISVIVPTYNRAKSLRQTLEALSAQVFREGLTLELLIVDNRSTDETKAVVEAAARTSRWPMRYLYEPRQGKSFALNTGIAAATGDFIAFTDDDTLPRQDWVKTLYETFAEHQADCVGGKILPRWLQEPPAWLKERERLWTHLALLDRGDEVRQVALGEGGWIWGANFGFRRAIFERTGTFRTDLGPQGGKRFGGEDGDMVRRVALAGGTVIYQPKAVVYHSVGAERMRLSYFRRLRFYEGISRQRVRGNGNAHASRIPRWLIRSCASHGVKALGAYTVGRTHRAIDEEMDFWTELGLIVGGLR